MQVAARTAAWAGGGAPYDEELVYLESSGTQMIDTGLLWHPYTTFSIKFEVVSNVGGWQYVMCNGPSGGKYNGIRWYGNNLSLRFFGALEQELDNQMQYEVVYNVHTELRSWATWGETQNCYCNGNEFTVYANGFDSATTTRLFKTLREYTSATRIYNYTQATNGVADNFIPVLARGVPAMYHVETGELLYNSGTGTFGYKKLDGTIVAPGGGGKLICAARRCTRSWRPSARFRARWEVAA